MADLLIKQECVNKDFGIKPSQWCIDFKIDSISNLIKTEWTSESDPYVYVSLEGNEGKLNLRTGYQKNQENPVFDRYRRVKLFSNQTLSLYVKLLFRELLWNPTHQKI